jgi:hypothetical protein
MSPIQRVADVKQFFTKMGWEIPADLRPLSSDLAFFRIKCMYEELDELNKAKSFEDLIDAVIDISYFAVGTAILMGEAEVLVTHARTIETSSLSRFQVMNDVVASNFDHVFKQFINDFDNVCRNDHYTAAVYLAEIINECERIARALGFSFAKHWAEVHKWNMLKEPATEKNPSKRGVVGYDAIKPPGWLGPDHMRVYLGEAHHALA